MSDESREALREVIGAARRMAEAVHRCPQSPSGEHEWVDDEAIGEGECLWCMARCTIGRFGRAPKVPNLRGRGA